MAPLRVMTANLWHEHVVPDGLDAVLEAVDPDVLAVNEVAATAATRIAARLPHHAFTVHGKPHGCGIALRRPGLILPLPMTYRDGWIARLSPVDWPGLPTEVTVIGVHLRNPVELPLGRSLVIRRRQFAALEAAVTAHPGPLVVAGDFNASPLWPGYRRITARLVDAAVAADTAHRTWSPRGVGRPVLRIDHVFVRGLTPCATSVVAVPSSDHLALVAELVV